MDAADSRPARPKALFILDRDRLDDIYSATEWQEIAQRVEVIAPPQTATSIGANLPLLREVELLFTGPGTAKLDATLLEAAPQLKVVFHGSQIVAPYFGGEVWERGISVVGGLNAEGHRMGRCMVEELRRYLAGEPLRWKVPAPTTERPVSPSAAAPMFERTVAMSPQPTSLPAVPPRGGMLARLRRRPTFLAVSILVHVLFFAAATSYVVSRYTTGRKPVFRSETRGPLPSQRALEHQVQVAKRQKMTGAPPPMARRIAISGASKIALPEMPALPSLAVPNRQAAMMSGSGSGAGLGFGRGIGSGGSAPMAGGGAGGARLPVSFFGIRDAGESVIIMIDVSDSMFTRTGDAEDRKLVKRGAEQSFQTVRDEAIKLVRSLPPSARFGIVRWGGGAYSWQPELVRATDENKQAAVEHITTRVDMLTAGPKGGRPGGTRHDFALEEAFALKPEVIYMLTDGNATVSLPGGGRKNIEPEDIWKVAAAGQKTLPKPARVHVIYYLTAAENEDERKMLRTLATRNGGKFRDVEAKGRKR